MEAEREWREKKRHRRNMLSFPLRRSKVLFYTDLLEGREEGLRVGVEAEREGMFQI